MTVLSKTDINSKHKMKYDILLALHILKQSRTRVLNSLAEPSKFASFL